MASSVRGAVLLSALVSRDAGGLLPFPLKPTVASALSSLHILGACEGRGQLSWEHRRGVSICASIVAAGTGPALLLRRSCSSGWGPCPQGSPGHGRSHGAVRPEAWVQLEGAACCLLPSFPPCGPLRQPGVPIGRGGRPLPAAETRSSLAPTGLAPMHHCPGFEPASRSWTPSPSGAARSSWGSTSMAWTTQPPGTHASLSSGPGEPSVPMMWHNPHSCGSVSLPGVVA